MKGKKLLLSLCVVITLASCSAGKAKDAFAEEKITIGSTYEEMVDAIGEPTRAKSSDKGMLATYSTILTNSHVFILLEKDANGVEHISAYTDDNIETIKYSKKLGLSLIW